MLKPILIFDLMDTVVADPFPILPGLLGLAMDELLKVKDPNSWPAFELGEIDEDEYFRRFYRPASGLRIADAEQLKRQFFAAYRFVEGMDLLLDELRSSGARLWIHSNYTQWIDVIRERLALDRFFEGYAVSFELKARKPDPKAYSAALAMIRERAENCLFIDDREANVAAARETGLQGIVFESAPQLCSALRRNGYETGLKD